MSVRTFLRNAAEVTKTDGEELLIELDRWSVLHDEAEDMNGSLEQRYSREFGQSEDEMRAREEGFRQAVGVPPSRLLELWHSAQAEMQQKVLLLDLEVVPVLEEPPAPLPSDNSERRGPRR